MRPTTDPKRNLLLAALTDDEWERCLSSFDCVSLRQGEVLYGGGAPQHHVFFPTTAVVSLMYVTREGASAEIAIVGNEGLVGLPRLLGGLSTPSNGMVLSAGDAIRIPAWAIRKEFDRAGPLTALRLRYTRALIAQTIQNGACNRDHALDQQLCRGLLICLDRVSGNELAMTQDLIASMLGVRREGVTEAALKLQAAGPIPLRARPHRRGRSSRAGAAQLRVLGRGQGRVRPAAATCISHRASRTVSPRTPAPAVHGTIGPGAVGPTRRDPAPAH